MVSLVSLFVVAASAGPAVETSVPNADPCLTHRAVRACDVLQLAVHTERGSFEAFVFAMHHPQAGVFWFQERDTGAFLRVAPPQQDAETQFLGAGWTARTADGVAYRVESVLRETYVLRRVEEGGRLASAP